MNRIALLAVGTVALALVLAIVGNGLVDLVSVDADSVTAQTGPDADGDGVEDAADNCPAWANPAQQPLQWSSLPGDSDCDGYRDTLSGGGRAPESTIGTAAAAHCAATSSPNDEPAPDAWPVDFNDNQLVNGADILMYNYSFGKFISAPPVNIPGQGSIPVSRFDLNGSGYVNGADILQFGWFMFQRCA